MVVKNMAVDKTKVSWGTGGQENRSHRMYEYPLKPIVYCSFTKHKNMYSNIVKNNAYANNILVKTLKTLVLEFTVQY